MFARSGDDLPLSSVLPTLQRLVVRELVQMKDTAAFWQAASKARTGGSTMIREWGAPATLSGTWAAKAPATVSTASTQAPRTWASRSSKHT